MFRIIKDVKVDRAYNVQKIFVILLSAVFIFLLVLFWTCTYSQYGDLSGDGLINSIDTSILNRHILEKATLYDITAADLNGDKVINSTDYALMQIYTWLHR